MTSLQTQHVCSRSNHLPRAVLAVIAFSVATIMSGPALAAMITVTGTGDTVAVDGIVTLREAMMSINAGAPINADVVAAGAYGTADTIDFNIAGAGVHTIAPASFLPTMTKPVTINGYSQPGTSANTNGPGLGSNAVLSIELNLAGARALTLNGGNSTVRGLVINRSHLSAGIDLQNLGGNTIAGNFIGTNPAGTAAGPGNDNAGININIANNTIGGLAAADRNVISGNVTTGITCCAAGVANNVIQNNLVGVSAAGTAALGNLAQGITISGTGNHVGSTNPMGRNVVSASGQHGIAVAGSANTVEGNFVGTDVVGGIAIPNLDGIFLSGGGNTIGGTVAGAGNLVSGNTIVGISLQNQAVPNNIVQGNLVGTNAAGAAAIAGHSTAGINIGPFVNGNIIGGTVAGAGNVIAFATGNGIRIDGAGATGGTGNPILGNKVFGNAKLGIKLGTATLDTVPTPNDPGDPDIGPNTLQNYPALTSAAITGANVDVSGTLNSTPSTTFRVELFANAACDVSGNGEGQSFLGFANVSTDAGGNVTFGPVTTPIPAGQKFITATATNPTNNTSEFSPCILATGPPALQSAASRKLHGAAGTFDLPLTLLPLNNPTTEPRQGPTATIVMTFDSAIISANVAVTESTATVGAVTFSGNDVIVPLNGVPNQQYVTISATNVSSAVNTGGSGTVRIGFLLGDVNGNRVVAVSDLGLVNSQLAQVVTAANFLKDINASGTLTVADKGIANANLAKALPAP